MSWYTNGSQWTASDDSADLSGMASIVTADGAVVTLRLERFSHFTAIIDTIRNAHEIGRRHGIRDAITAIKGLP